MKYIRLIIFSMILLLISATSFADTMVGSLPELAGAPSSGDEIYINDGGTGKKISVNNFFTYFPFLASISSLTETNGGLLYGTSDNNYGWLPAGTLNYILQGNGAAAPSWTNAPTVSGVNITGVLHDSDFTQVGGILVGTGNGIYQEETGGTFRTSIGLGNVENTAISTWGGSTNIIIVGTIGTGIWQATVIDEAYLDTALARSTASQSADNRLVRTDGTGNGTIQDSGISIDDSNNMSGVASIVIDANANPSNIFNDSDAPGAEAADKEVASIKAQYSDGAEDAENGTLTFNVHDAGSETQVMKINGTTKTLTIDYVYALTPELYQYTASGDVTIASTVKKSVVMLDGDNDGADETLDLQDGTVNGQMITFIAYADIDDIGTDHAIIDAETDSTCTTCPNAGIFTLIELGNKVTLMWYVDEWYYMGSVE